MTLEKLLNILCEKGWKPFGDENVKEIKIYSDMDMECIYGKKKSDFYYFSPRKITSMESGLWQFVCKNDMVDKKKIGIFYEMFLEENGIDAKNYRPFSLVERLIIESALCKEENLEKFLLDNIKVDAKSN